MDAKFERRFKSFCNSLDALAEARQRDLSDSFVLVDMKTVCGCKPA